MNKKITREATMKKYLIIVICVALAGCVSASTKIKVNSGSFLSQPLTPKSNDAEIALITKDLDKPYKEIGIISVEGHKNTTYDELNEKMKQKAREMGADAVIKIEYGNEIKGGMVPSTYGYGSLGVLVHRPSCKGIAVVFIDKKS